MWFLYKEDLCGRPRYIKNTCPKVELTANIGEAHLFDMQEIRALLIMRKIAFKDNWNAMSCSNGQVERLTHAFMIENEVLYTEVRGRSPFVFMDDVVSFFRTAGGGQNA